MGLQYISDISSFDDLLIYLEEQLNWDLQGFSKEEVTYEFEAAELGLKTVETFKINGPVRQLRPITDKQSFGIFFIEFETENLPIMILRRVLNSLIVKKRVTSVNSDRATFEAENLLFITKNKKSDGSSEINFVHFQRKEAHELPSLRVLGWDGADTVLELNYVDSILKEKFRWPEADQDLDIWVQGWSSIFKETPSHVLKTSDALARALASFSKRLRDSALVVLKYESERTGSLKNLFKAFKVSLIHDLTVEDFADTYAQTISYGLLTAAISRTDINSGTDGTCLIAEDITHMVPITNPFLKEMLETFLKVGGKEDRIDFDELGIQDLVDLLQGEKTDLPAILRNFGRDKPQEDPVIHFYEHFLEFYNKEKKIEKGVFYTPKAVVSYIVRTTHEKLINEFGLEDGLADTSTWGQFAKRNKSINIPNEVNECDFFVKILDPATGTGTFIVEVIELVYQFMTKKWDDKGFSISEKSELWNKYVSNSLLPRLYGYELMMAPYAIAHMKIGLKLWETGYHFRQESRVNLFLTDSLEPPQDSLGKLAFEIPALSNEAMSVSEVKEKSVFTVIIGNPPYLREKDKNSINKKIGGWIRHGDDKNDAPPLFNDFIKPLAESNQQVHAKLAYELSVMFWRLAFWLGIERSKGVGIISMITPRAYLTSPGHAGMRKFLKENSDLIFLTDLGGDNRGARKSANIFDIETGVAIGTCIKMLFKEDFPLQIFYKEILGLASDKLKHLTKFDSFKNIKWKTCDKTSDYFLPQISKSYSKWPKLSDIFPWQHSGVQFKRLWTISPCKKTLEKRWYKLISLPSDQKAKAFVETDARLIKSQPKGTKSIARFTGIIDICENDPPPEISRYCYRALDRQWAMIDARLADRIRPQLINVMGEKQIFACTMMSKQLGEGSAICVTNLLPDLDIFCNRGAGDIIPLWRDADARNPNIAPTTITKFSSILGDQINAKEIFAYSVAMLASPYYSSRFKADLTIPGPRIPITKEPSLFKRGVRLGSYFIWLQTFGEVDLCEDHSFIKSAKGRAKLIHEISSEIEKYPNEFTYNPELEVLIVGDGRIENVSNEVMEYNQSGWKILPKWLSYRMKIGAGRVKKKNSRSELDLIRPSSWTFTNELMQLIWTIEKCIELWPDLDDLLDEIIDNDEFISEEHILPIPEWSSSPPKVENSKQSELF